MVVKSTARSNEGMADYWKRVGPKLDEIRRRELRQFDHEANIGVIDALLQIAVDHGTRKTTSGLVELQRRLAKGRRSGM